MLCSTLPYFVAFINGERKVLFYETVCTDYN